MVKKLVKLILKIAAVLHEQWLVTFLGFYKECKRTLRLSKETVEEIASDFDGTLEELYIQLQEKYQTCAGPALSFGEVFWKFDDPGIPKTPEDRTPTIGCR